MRVLGLSPADLSGWRDPASPNKWAPFFRALQPELDVVEVLRPPVAPGRRALALAGRAAGGRLPVGRPWSARGFAQRTAATERLLRDWEGRYDLVFQLQTLFGPGTRPRPYAICTDSTHALLARHDPTARPVSPSRAHAWQAAERTVAQGAVHVLTWSEFARRSFIEDYGVAPERVTAAGAGANLVLDEVPDRRAQRPTALFVGYEFARKGGHVLLEAWGEVERRVAEAELVVAGPRKPVASSARRVRWVGPVGRDEVARLYREATVFVLPSLFEPFGLVFLEAMGQGLPVVASDCCAMPELVREGKTGALAPPGDAAALAEALTGLLADPERAAAQGRAGHADVLTRHTWEQVGERMRRALLDARAAA